MNGIFVYPVSSEDDDGILRTAVCAANVLK
jgi:hypothetical protein